MVIKPLNVLALVCGASFDVFKCALVRTDGVDVYDIFDIKEYPLPAFLRVKTDLIRGKKTTNPDDKVLIDMVENDMTDIMIETLKNMKSSNQQAIDLIGLEGPTITHDISEKYTYQLGKGQRIFEALNIKVVSHFHNADVLNGGRGNPLSATYFQALAAKMKKPVLFINIGAVSSLIYIGPLGEMLSFDCAAGNAMLGDFMKKHAGLSTDYNGKCAACGKPDLKIVRNLMRHIFFEILPPKAMAPDMFEDKIEHFEGLSLEDGAATITEFIAEGIVQSVNKMLPSKPVQTLICGDGGKNPTLVRLIKQKLKESNIDAELYQADDAAAVAFLAARCYYHLPITFPQTTGVSEPMTGGKLYQEK